MKLLLFQEIIGIISIRDYQHWISRMHYNGIIESNSNEIGKDNSIRDYLHSRNLTLRWAWVGEGDTPENEGIRNSVPFFLKGPIYFN